MASTGPCTIPALSCTTLTILTHRRRPSQPRRLFPPLLVSRNLRGAGLFSANARVGGHTVVVTQTSTAGAATAAPPSGPNTAGIAAGVVVAVVVVGAIVGGVFFYMRRRRNHEIEEEHRRNAAVSSFINGGHPPSSSSSHSDSRLDPVMAQRRMSDGSIADNQDYSRKILRVSPDCSMAC